MLKGLKINFKNKEGSKDDVPTDKDSEDPMSALRTVQKAQAQTELPAPTFTQGKYDFSLKETDDQNDGFGGKTVLDSKEAIEQHAELVWKQLIAGQFHKAKQDNFELENEYYRRSHGIANRKENVFEGVKSANLLQVAGGQTKAEDSKNNFRRKEQVATHLTLGLRLRQGGF